MTTSTLNPIQRIKTITDKFDQEHLYNKDTNEIDIEKMFAYSTMINVIIEDTYGKEIADDYEIYEHCVEKSIYPIKYDVEYEMINNHNDITCDIDSLVEKYKNTIITKGESKIYNYILNKIRFFRDSGFHVTSGNFVVRVIGSTKNIGLLKCDSMFVN